MNPAPARLATPLVRPSRVHAPGVVPDASPAPTDPIDALRERARSIDWGAIAPEGRYARHGRRALDLAVVLVLAPLAIVPMALIALVNTALFRDPRKVFFTQDRVGYRGEVFSIYKFRTMYDAGGSAEQSWASGGDRLRVTRFGRFLRNAHLDELPQLWNIVKGDMGIIGPRPEMVAIEAWATREVPGFMERLRIRPGITGWAQITQGYTGRCRDAYAHKLAANEAVTCRPSLRRDVEILARTAIWMLRGKGWEWKLQGRPTTTEEVRSTSRAA